MRVCESSRPASLQLWSASGVGYTPTLGVAYGGPSGENYWYAPPPLWENARLLAFAPRSMIDAASRRREIAPDEEYNDDSSIDDESSSSS